MASQTKTNGAAALLLAMIVVLVGSAFVSQNVFVPGASTVPALEKDKPRRVDFKVEFHRNDRRVKIKWQVGGSGDAPLVTASPWLRVQYANPGDVATLSVTADTTDPSQDWLECFVYVDGKLVRSSGRRIFLCDEKIIVV